MTTTVTDVAGEIHNCGPLVRPDVRLPVPNPHPVSRTVNNGPELLAPKLI